MLRRVKKDVVSELTTKTEVTVHCKLSSRQQAFYQAIKNKISLAELFDSNRGQLNEKKILNLMNIVIQLRKVDNPYCSGFISHALIFVSIGSFRNQDYCVSIMSCSFYFPPRLRIINSLNLIGLQPSGVVRKE